MKNIGLVFHHVCLITLLCTGSALATPANSAAELMTSGEQLLQNGKLAEAEKKFTAAAQSDPRSVDALMKLAGVQIAENNFSSAIKTYKSAIGLNPSNAKAFIGLGIAYLHSGDKSMTRAALEEALRLEPARKDQLTPILAYLDKP